MSHNKTWQVNFEALLIELEKTAVDRDKIGGHAQHERELIKKNGLLNLLTSRSLGGEELDWESLFKVIRRLASVDSSIAHVLAFHYLQLITIKLYGDNDLYEYYSQLSIQQDLFWGNALNPKDKRAIAKKTENGYIIEGPKSFSSGSVGSDYLIFSAWDEEKNDLLIALSPSNRDGIEILENWDAFGQKQTDSGIVHFHSVSIEKNEILILPKHDFTPYQTLRTLIAQLVLTNLYIGIAEGALKSGIDYTKNKSKPWTSSGVKEAIEDPFIQHRYAELYLDLKSAVILADKTAQQIDLSLNIGESLTQEERGKTAIAVYEAKILAHRASLHISNDIFELMGASATSTRYGYDRFWRNARVHTLHDPIDYKIKDIGRYLLEGIYPDPSSYS